MPTEAYGGRKCKARCILYLSTWLRSLNSPGTSHKNTANGGWVSHRADLGVVVKRNIPVRDGNPIQDVPTELFWMSNEYAATSVPRVQSERSVNIHSPLLWLRVMAELCALRMTLVAETRGQARIIWSETLGRLESRNCQLSTCFK
jgi:hypothetical protein